MSHDAPPGPVSPAVLRDVLGHFVSGIVVVTAAGPDGPAGLHLPVVHVAVARPPAGEPGARPHVHHVAADPGGGRVLRQRAGRRARGRQRGVRPLRSGQVRGRRVDARRPPAPRCSTASAHGSTARCGPSTTAATTRSPSAACSTSAPTRPARRCSTTADATASGFVELFHQALSSALPWCHDRAADRRSRPRRRPGLRVRRGQGGQPRGAARRGLPGARRLLRGHPGLRAGRRDRRASTRVLDAGPDLPAGPATPCSPRRSPTTSPPRSPTPTSRSARRCRSRCGRRPRPRTSRARASRVSRTPTSTWSASTRCWTRCAGAGRRSGRTGPWPTAPTRASRTRAPSSPWWCSGWSTRRPRACCSPPTRSAVGAAAACSTPRPALATPSSPARSTPTTGWSTDARSPPARPRAAASPTGRCATSSSWAAGSRRTSARRRTSSGRSTARARCGSPSRARSPRSTRCHRQRRPGLRVHLNASLAQGLTRPITPMGLSAFRVVGASLAGLATGKPVDPMARPRGVRDRGRPGVHRHHRGAAQPGRPQGRARHLRCDGGAFGGRRARAARRRAHRWRHPIGVAGALVVRPARAADPAPLPGARAHRAGPGASGRRPQAWSPRAASSCARASPSR